MNKGVERVEQSHLCGAPVRKTEKSGDYRVITDRELHESLTTCFVYSVFYVDRNIFEKFLFTDQYCFINIVKYVS